VTSKPSSIAYGCSGTAQDCTRASATSPPTTNTKDEARPSAPHDEPAYAPPTTPELPPDENYEKITRKPPPVVGNFEPQLVHLVRRTSLCGVSPLETSSGKTHRHRLNRGGDRQAGAALYRITLSRLRGDVRTRDYLTRRITEGKTQREAIRCLKRYLAREIDQIITSPPTAEPSAA